MTDTLIALPDPSGHDHSPSDVTWITVDAAASLLVEAQLPRNPRTIRRYCMRGDLECQKTENALHQPQYFISQSSVQTYIAQQKTLLAGRPDQSGLDRTVPDMSCQSSLTQNVDGDDKVEAGASGQVQTHPGMSGHDRISSLNFPASRNSDGSVVVEQLEARIADKDAEIAFLRGELLHRRTTDTALHDVIAAFRANAEAQRLAVAPQQQAANSWPSKASPSSSPVSFRQDGSEQGTSEPDSFVG